jgi:Domain of unknown function (DUF4386)
MMGPVVGTTPRRDGTDTIKKNARVAGLLDLLSGIPAVFSYQYVPGALIVRGDAAATAERVTTSEWLLRFGIASELISSILFIFLVLALYRLFKGVDRGLASLMVILVLVSIPISFVNVLSEIAAVTLLTRADLLSVFDKPQLDALASMFLGLHGQGLAVVSIFWGLWLLPLGVLVMRSGFAPRVIGVLLIPAGLAYVIASATNILPPPFATVVSRLAPIPEGLGEVPMLLWLLITGMRGTRLERAESPTRPKLPSAESK